MNSDLRTRLIAAGTRVLDEHGPHLLQARRLAAESGTSTMAVYSQFGGMKGLVDAITDEAFAAFTRRLAEVPGTEDPIADFFALAAVYREYAMANPQRYQLMFGLADSRPVAADRALITVAGDTASRSKRAASFDILIDAVDRMIANHDIRGDGAVHMAARLWCAIHGEVLLEMAGFFGRIDQERTPMLTPLLVDLLVGMATDGTLMRERAGDIPGR